MIAVGGVVSERFLFMANPMCIKVGVAYFAMEKKAGGDVLMEQNNYRIAMFVAMIPCLTALACSALSLYLGEVAR